MSEPTASGTPMPPSGVDVRHRLRGRIGSAQRWRAVLRAEVRKHTSVRLWWALLVPVVLLSLLTSQFGSLVTLILPSASDDSAIRLTVGVASATSVVSIIAAIFGAMCASGEFRHRTVTPTYLTAGRAQVLCSKVVVSAAVGGLYGLVMAVLGPLLGGAVLGRQTAPPTGILVALGAVGVALCALWAAIGVAIGTVVSSQVGAVALTIGYMVLGENALSTVLRLGASETADPSWIARASSFLPSNAGEVPLYEPAATQVGDPRDVDRALEFLAGVSAPPPGWGSLLVLLAWTLLAIATAALVGGRRNIT